MMDLQPWLRMTSMSTRGVLDVVVVVLDGLAHRLADGLKSRQSG